MKIPSMIPRWIAFFTLAVCTAATVRAEVVEYDLTIARQEFNFTGSPAAGMSINGTIPGPVLRFKEGDLAQIHVHNAMDVDTSIHWHGVLVPPGMDGVPRVSFPPIAPNATFTYEFPIRQSGTYWYHSHSALQEQSGVYGAIVITSHTQMSAPHRDHVVLLSDWTDEDPHTVNRTLKRGNEWYALQKGSSQSIAGAARLGMLGDYYIRELQRMPAMDIADVAYDRFLANGKPETVISATNEETVRLRVVDGSATTYFHLQFAGGPMTIVAADGQDVQTLQLERLLIGVAETYDLLVRVPAEGMYELRATAHDGSGYTSVWIGSGKCHAAPDVPKPNLYLAMGDLDWGQVVALTPAGAMGMSDAKVAAGEFDRPGMVGMGSMGMQTMGKADMSAHPGMNKGAMAGMPVGEQTPAMPMEAMGHGRNTVDMAPSAPHDAISHGIGAMQKTTPSADAMASEIAMQRSARPYGKRFGLLASDVSESKHLAVDGVDSERPMPPYDKLRATRPTAFSKNKPVREIRLTLDGDMQRYVWMFNNKTLYESNSIRIREGEVTRFIMINRTMMHHPMHLHGHFFRVINGQGDFAPLKHTVDVAPMSTTVIEFDASEVGDWFFHCHLLYHMKAGMTRVVHYENFVVDPQVAAIRSDLYKEPRYAWGQADVLSNMTEGYLTLSNTRNVLMARWEVGWQGVEDTQSEGIVTWERYVNRFFSPFAGLDFGDAIEQDRGILGIRYLLPLNVQASAFGGTDGNARFMLEKHFELTPRIGILGHTRYNTDKAWEGGLDLTYTISKSVDIVGRYHSEYGLGAGVQVRF